MNYIHLRARNPNNTPITKGGTTIAWRINSDGSLEIAVAHCHFKDNFCRRIGRAIAEGRMRVGKSHIIAKQDEFPDFRTMREFIVNMVKNIA